MNISGLLAELVNSPTPLDVETVALLKRAAKFRRCFPGVRAVFNPVKVTPEQLAWLESLPSDMPAWRIVEILRK